MDLPLMLAPCCRYHWTTSEVVGSLSCWAWDRKAGALYAVQMYVQAQPAEMVLPVSVPADIESFDVGTRSIKVAGSGGLKAGTASSLVEHCDAVLQLTAPSIACAPRACKDAQRTVMIILVENQATYTFHMNIYCRLDDLLAHLIRWASMVSKPAADVCVEGGKPAIDVCVGRWPTAPCRARPPQRAVCHLPHKHLPQAY